MNLGKLLNQTLKWEHESDTVHRNTGIEIVFPMLQKVPQFENCNEEEVTEWLKMDGADSDFQLLTDEGKVDSINT